MCRAFQHGLHSDNERRLSQDLIACQAPRRAILTKDGKNNLVLLSAADDKLFPENNIKSELRIEATSFTGREGEGVVTDKMEETFLSQPSKECVREGGRESD